MAYAHTSSGSNEHTSLLNALRQQPEIQVAAAYLGGAWLFYEVADLVVFVFDLPEGFLRAALGLLAIGSVVALLFGRWLRLTLLAIRQGTAESPEDIIGVPDFLEPALLRTAETVSRRTTVLATTSATIVFAFLFLFLWTSWAAAHERQIPDSRVTIVVFPFDDPGSGGDGLGYGLADLLSVTLDGTPGIRIVDPSAAWRSLPTSANGAPTPPSTSDARALSLDLGATSFVTGDVVRSGSSLEIGAQIHRTDPTQSGVPVRVSAHEDSLGNALQRVAVQVVAATWERGQLPTVPEIDRSATESVEALKAYLEAMGAFRQGRLEVARESIERAIGVDSTFALAHLARFSIESWLDFADGGGSPTNLREMIESAARHGQRLTPRNRMRIDAGRALDETDGSTAAFLYERILEIDSLDVDALDGLASAQLLYGWQFGREFDDIISEYRRVTRADSSNTSALATLTRLALWRDDRAAAGSWLRRLMAEDSLGAYARGTQGGYQIITAQAVTLDSLLAAWGSQEVGVVMTVLRDLRTARPDLADRYLAELRADSMPSYHQAIASGAQAQLWMARGRVAAVDSLVQTPALEGLRRSLAGFQIAAAMAGVGDPEIAAAAATELADYTPLDSLQEYASSRNDLWTTAWAVGAYHASLGDTARARAWAEAIAEVPPGESTTVPLWPSSLANDIEARVAARRGDTTAAEDLARTAYEQWNIHSLLAFESEPAPAMRFHLAELLRVRGAAVEAERFYRSLTPPHTFMGFYTARSALELARIREAAGDLAEAASYYRLAVRLWEAGEPAVVAEWLDDARSGLARSGG